MGIPVIGCRCAVCTCELPENQRYRPSALLRIAGKTILIDPGPDFRDQALKIGLDHLDGVILTHTHYDHIGGLDELRIFFFRQKKAIPFLLSRESYEDVQRRYHYLFGERPKGSNFTAQLDFQILETDRGAVDFLGLPFHYMTYYQGGMAVLGLRYGNFAFLSDISEYPETIFEDLQGCEAMVVSALRDSESPVHFSLEEAVGFSGRVGVKRSWITHVGHELDHFIANSRLPERVRMAYDGLEVDIDDSGAPLK